MRQYYYQKERTVNKIIRIIRNLFKRPFCENCIIFGILLFLIGGITIYFKVYDIGGFIGIVGALLLGIGLAILFPSKRSESKNVIIINQGR